MKPMLFGLLWMASATSWAQETPAGTLVLVDASGGMSGFCPTSDECSLADSIKALEGAWRPVTGTGDFHTATVFHHSETPGLVYGVVSKSYNVRSLPGSLFRGIASPDEACDDTFPRGVRDTNIAAVLDDVGRPGLDDRLDNCGPHGGVVSTRSAEDGPPSSTYRNVFFITDNIQDTAQDSAGSNETILPALQRWHSSPTHTPAMYVIRDLDFQGKLHYPRETAGKQPRANSPHPRCPRRPEVQRELCGRLLSAFPPEVRAGIDAPVWVGDENVHVSYGGPRDLVVYALLPRDAETIAPLNALQEGVEPSSGLLLFPPAVPSVPRQGSDEEIGWLSPGRIEIRLSPQVEGSTLPGSRTCEDGEGAPLQPWLLEVDALDAIGNLPVDSVSGKVEITVVGAPAWLEVDSTPTRTIDLVDGADGQPGRLSGTFCGPSLEVRPLSWSAIRDHFSIGATLQVELQRLQVLTSEARVIDVLAGPRASEERRVWAATLVDEKPAQDFLDPRRPYAAGWVLRAFLLDGQDGGDFTFDFSNTPTWDRPRATHPLALGDLASDARLWTGMLAYIGLAAGWCIFALGVMPLLYVVMAFRSVGSVSGRRCRAYLTGAYIVSIGAAVGAATAFEVLHLTWVPLALGGVALLVLVPTFAAWWRVDSRGHSTPPWSSTKAEGETTQAVPLDQRIQPFHVQGRLVERADVLLGCTGGFPLEGPKWPEPEDGRGEAIVLMASQEPIDREICAAFASISPAPKLVVCLEGSPQRVRALERRLAKHFRPPANLGLLLPALPHLQVTTWNGAPSPEWDHSLASWLSGGGSLSPGHRLQASPSPPNWSNPPRLFDTICAALGQGGAGSDEVARLLKQVSPPESPHPWTWAQASERWQHAAASLIEARSTSEAASACEKRVRDLERDLLLTLVPPVYATAHRRAVRGVLAADQETARRLQARAVHLEGALEDALSELAEALAGWWWSVDRASAAQ